MCYLKKRLTELGLLVPLLVVSTACQKTPEKLYPVTGTVTVGGQPLSGGTVQFEMLDKGKASGEVFTAAGAIEADGSYELSTFGKRGAPAGDHRVWVSPNFAALPDKLGVGVERMSPVPKKYMLPTTTDLSYTVTEGENQIDVEVPKR